ncbi:hypothetical protein Tco_0047078 [Tanacetum coccineum]
MCLTVKKPFNVEKIALNWNVNKNFKDKIQEVMEHFSSLALGGYIPTKVETRGVTEELIVITQGVNIENTKCIETKCYDVLRQQSPKNESSSDDLKSANWHANLTITEHSLHLKMILEKVNI